MGLSYNPSNRDYRVLYPTHNSTDPLFQAGNNQAESGTASARSHDNVDNGTDAERLANCQSLVGQQATDSSIQIGQAVQPGTLDAW